MPDTQIKDGCTIRPSFFSPEKDTPRTPCLLVAYNAPKAACQAAEAAGCRVLHIPEWDRLPTPVSGHPDMLVFPLPDLEGKTRLLLAEEYYAAHADFWRATGLPIALTKHPFGNLYPADIGLNQLVMDGWLYGRLDAAVPEVLDAYPEQISVRQGYARCSVLKLTEHAAITADRSIAAALEQNGIEVLLIRAGHIRLDGYNYGFIGGASFPLPTLANIRNICFFGNLSAHPDAAAISAFAEKHDVRLHSTSGELADFGGGILIDPRQNITKYS